MTSVCLSVRLSVTLTDYDHTMQQKVEITHDRQFGVLTIPTDNNAVHGGGCKISEQTQNANCGIIKVRFFHSKLISR